MSQHPLTKAHRTQLRTLTGLAERDLSIIWARIATASDATVVRDNLATILPQLVTLYGAAAATLAADYYDELRAETGIDSRFAAIVADLPDEGRTEALAGFAVGPLFQAEPDLASALTLAQGGLQNIIADASRETVMESSYADPRAQGWERITDGGCDFCEMLGGRGTVFSESSADFASHDHCQCTASPAFEGESKPVKTYTPSLRESSDADRARVRQWIRDNPTK